MDDDCFFNGEKQSIRDSGRSLKKYGSTCNHVRNNEQLIRHELNKTDTLQGIALKYGCSVCVFFCIWHLCIYVTRICFCSATDGTNSSLQPTIRARQPISATIPYDSRGQGLALLSKRRSAAIVAHIFGVIVVLAQQCGHGWRRSYGLSVLGWRHYVRQVVGSDTATSVESGRGESQGYRRISGQNRFDAGTNAKIRGQVTEQFWVSQQ